MASLPNECQEILVDQVRIDRAHSVAQPLGFALFQQGKSKEAVVALEKAVAVDPKHWKSHNNLALAAIDIGELEVAEAHYRDSLAIKPQPAIYNDLGVVLERQGLPEEAAEAYRKAIKLDPKSASAHLHLGSSLARSGKFADAESQLRSAIKADPKNAAAHLKLAEVLERRGHTERRAGRSKRRRLWVVRPLRTTSKDP